MSILLVFIILAAISLEITAQILPVITITNASTSTTTSSLAGHSDFRTCECDIYSSQCDYSCCCDPDCTQAIIEFWKGRGLCYQEERYLTIFQHCDDDNDLAMLTDPYEQKYIKFRQVGSLDCVKYERTAPKLGYYYNEQPVSTDSAPTIPASARNLYKTAQERISFVEGYSAPSTYSTGVSLYTQLTSGTTTLVESRFIVPVQSFITGECDDTATARFLMDIAPRSCSRYIAFTDQCTSGGVLSADYWVTNRGVLAAPSLTTTIITITPSATLTAATSAGSTTTCTCTNAVTSVDYQFVVSGGTITAASAIVTVGTLTTATSCDTADAVVQTFSVQFVTSADAIPKSGNPGYLDSYPLLMGTLNNVSNVSTISRPQAGFYIPGVSTGGSCLIVGGTASQFDAFLIPKFRENLYVSCQRTFLSGDCSAANGLESLQLFSSITDQTYFGRFGNANVNYIKDWVQANFTKEFSEYNITTITGTTTCQIPTEMRVLVLYSGAGYSYNQQNYIIDVRVELTEQALIANDDLATFGLNITFVEVSQDEIDPSNTGLADSTGFFSVTLLFNSTLLIFYSNRACLSLSETLKY